MSKYLAFLVRLPSSFLFKTNGSRLDITMMGVSSWTSLRAGGVNRSPGTTAGSTSWCQLGGIPPLPLLSLSLYVRLPELGTTMTDLTPVANYALYISTTSESRPKLSRP